MKVLTSTCTQVLTEKFNSKRKAKYHVRESKNLNQYFFGLNCTCTEVHVMTLEQSSPVDSGLFS